jgi:hypothetical protein
MKALNEVIEYATYQHNLFKEWAKEHEEKADAFRLAGMDKEEDFHVHSALEYRVRASNYDIMLQALELYKTTLKYEQQ